MQFRIIHNLETGKKTYYVDNKRVLLDRYDFLRTFCSMNPKLHYNSAWQSTKGKYRRSGFCYS